MSAATDAGDALSESTPTLTPIPLIPFPVTTWLAVWLPPLAGDRANERQPDRPSNELNDGRDGKDAEQLLARHRTPHGGAADEHRWDPRPVHHKAFRCADRTNVRTRGEGLDLQDGHIHPDG